jgi:excisionase family DNA binding protein
MARQMPDMGIAAALNRAGKTTTKGHSWTRTRVASLRKDHNIVVYREGERAERGEVTLDEAAEALSVSPATVRRLIVEGALPANQSCKGGPWAIRASDLGRAEVAREAKRRRKRSRIGPPSEDEPELALNFQ